MAAWVVAQAMAVAVDKAAAVTPSEGSAQVATAVPPSLEHNLSSAENVAEGQGWTLAGMLQGVDLGNAVAKPLLKKLRKKAEADGKVWTPSMEKEFAKELSASGRLERLLAQVPLNEIVAGAIAQGFAGQPAGPLPESIANSAPPEVRITFNVAPRASVKAPPEVRIAIDCINVAPPPSAAKAEAVAALQAVAAKAEAATTSQAGEATAKAVPAALEQHKGGGVFVQHTLESLEQETQQADGPTEDAVQAELKQLQGMDVNEPDADGLTLLMQACVDGHVERACAVIKAGANLEATDGCDRTALMISVCNRQERCLHALIEAKANLEATTEDGRTALILAASFGHESCLRALIQATANLEAKDEEGCTALMIPPVEGLASALEGHASCMRALIEAGANDAKHTLHSVALRGDLQAVQQRLSSGAAVDERTAKGSTALMLCAKQGQEPCLRALIEAKANIEATDQKGSTALVWAAGEGQEPCLRALIEAGANVEAAENGGRTALILSAASDLDCLRALIEAKANIEATDKGSYTALLRSAEYGHEPCLRALIEAKANVEAAESERGLTALMISAEQGDEPCTRALIEAGASKDAKAKDGATALSLLLDGADELGEGADPEGVRALLLGGS